MCIGVCVGVYIGVHIGVRMIYKHEPACVILTLFNIFDMDQAHVTDTPHYNHVMGTYSAIHKATGKTISSFAWYNSCGTEKIP